MTLEGIEAVRGHLATVPFHDWAKIHLVSVGEGHAEMQMVVEDQHLNPLGVVHGGVIAGLLDATCGLSIVTLFPDEPPRTFQLTVTYLRGATKGRTLIASAEAMHRGASVAYAQGKIVDEAGRAVAHATSVNVLPARTTGMREGDLVAGR